MRIEFHKRWETLKIAIFSLNQLKSSRARSYSTFAMMMMMRCDVHPQNVQEKIFFLSTQILCGFLFIFKLFPLSHFSSFFSCVWKWTVAELSSKRSTCLFLLFISHSPAVIRSSLSNAGNKTMLKTMKNLFASHFDLLSHHVHIALSENSPFKYKTPSTNVASFAGTLSVECDDENDKMEAKKEILDIIQDSKTLSLKNNILSDYAKVCVRYHSR